MTTRVYFVTLTYADGDATWERHVHAPSAFEAIIRARGEFHDDYPHFTGEFTAITSQKSYVHALPGVIQ